MSRVVLVVARASAVGASATGERPARLISYGTIEVAVNARSTMASTLRPRVTAGSDPLARIAYTSAAMTTAAQSATCVRSSRPRLPRPGATCPYAKNATTAAVATIAPRRRSRNTRASTAQAITAPRTLRASGAATSTGRTSARFAAYRNSTAYAANSTGWSGTRDNTLIATDSLNASGRGYQMFAS